MLKLFKRSVNKENIAKKEVSSSSYIPYECHWNKDTLLTKKHEFVKVIKLDGFPFETADDDDIEIKKNLRNQLYKNLEIDGLTLNFHLIRKKETLKDTGLISNYEIDSTRDFISYLTDEWRNKYSKLVSYFNKIYLTLVYKPDTSGVAIFEHLTKKLLNASEENASIKELLDIEEIMDEMTNRVLSTLSDYNPQVLSVVKTDDGYKCEILKFLYSIVNCAEESDVLLPKDKIDEYIPATRLFFGSRSLEALSPISRKYGGIITIKEYGPSTYPGMFDRFLQMPFEFIISQSFTFTNRSIAINKMQLQQNRMIQSEDKAVSQIHEISQALDMAMSGDIGFGEHHMTILCIDNDIKSLENTLSKAAVELSNSGMQSVRETVNLEASFWAQLPGNNSYIARKSLVNTLNIADFASMHNYPIGQASGNFWGPFVTLMETTSGTPFFFNFHVRDVGHTLIIGPTGAGKTVLLNFLCAQSQKFKPRLFFFDKDKGAEIFLKAIDAIYTVIDPGKKCGFNPLQLDDNGENRTFILEWLKILVSTNGEIITSEDIRILTQAVEGNFRLNKKDRKLSNIVAFLGVDGPGTLASRIGMWIGNGSHSNVFDNDEDAIDFSISRTFGFEMAELLADPVSLSPVLLYIFHRINISLDGSPTIIVLDEAWALIDNKVFAPKIKDWLKVLRKLNAFVIFATQSVEDAVKSSISDTLIQQTATQIFLTNLKATDYYKKYFMLTEREFEIVRTTDPSSRFFLVKQGIGSIVARIDLSGMNKIINVLSGRTETIILAEDLMEKYGEKSEKWLEKFYKEIEKI